ncbi:MAG: 4Fe-4S binding protein [Spirochaetes bacterium]|nr:4Fe-4S binding protein [Spirochaetota bacterium]
MSLEFDFKGIRLKNPVIVTAGEHGRDGKTIREVAASGVGAITTKTITNIPLPDPLPCYAKIDNGFLNVVLSAVHPAEQWFDTDMAEAKKGGVPVIANFAGSSPSESAELAKKCEDAGADMIELPTHCPHLAENIEAQIPEIKLPPPEIYDPKPFYETVKAVRKSTSLPLIGKLSAIFHLNTKNWVKAGVDAGLDAIEVADTLGPVMLIDIATGQPKLGGPRGFGGLSGGALKPLTLRMVFEIAQDFDITIIGSGGISTYKDAVEYIMAGASMVGVCTVGHLKGIGAYTKLIKDLERYFDENDTTLEEIRGLALKKVEQRKKKGLAAITKPLPPEITAERCNACGICERSCIYGAITVDDVVHVDSGSCYGCGLCADVCPKHALEMTYYK